MHQDRLHPEVGDFSGDTGNFESVDIESYRKFLFDRMLGILLILGFPVIVVVTYLLLSVSDYRTLGIYYGFYLFALSGLLLRKRIPFRLRAGVWLFAFYLLGVFVLWRVGVFGAGGFYLVTFCLLVTALVGVRYGILAMFISIATFLVISLGVSWNLFTFPGHGLVASDSPFAWLLAALLFAMLVSSMILTSGILQKRLLVAVKRLKEKGQKLTESNQLVRQEMAQRERAQQIQMETMDKLSAVVDASQAGFLIVDTQGNVRDANDTYVRLVGFQYLEQILHRNIKEWTAPHLVTDLSNAIKQCCTLGSIDFFETELMDKKGRVTPLEISAKQLKIQGRERIVAVCRDISDRKKAEAEFRELEDQLRQSQKLEAIGRLAGGVAHDFNNILQIIYSLSSVGLASHEEESAEPYFQGILRAAGRAKELVEQILTFSRQSDAEKTALDPKPVIADALKIVGAGLPINVTLKKNLSEDTDMLYADPAQLQQVVINLCNNAIHAMEESGGCLEVSFEISRIKPGQCAEPQPGYYWLLTVKDEGHGISENNLQRIFDPFFTTKKVGQGPGLGLSVVHGIVRENDGAILVKSDPKEGTKVSVYFPVTDEAPVHTAPLADSVPKGKGRILLVDDEMEIVNLSRRFLEFQGYTVLSATGGTQALELFLHSPDKIDLVVTDVAMPGMNGLELARTLQENAPGTKIILSTGNENRVDKNSFEALNILDVLQKPYKPAKLYQSINKVLS